jgi:hypothetical protein
MLKRLKIARHVAVEEGDPHTRIDGKPAVLPSEHVGGGREQQPLDLSKKDLRERCDGLGAVGEHAAQSLRHRNHPLPYGDRRNDVIGEVCGGLCHVATVAGWADAPSLAGESDDEPPAAARAQSAGESQAEDAACEVAAEFLADGARHGPLGVDPRLEPGLEVLGDDLVKRRLLWPAALVAAGGTTGPWGATGWPGVWSGCSRRCAGRDHDAARNPAVPHQE